MCDKQDWTLRALVAASLSYAGLLSAFWFVAQHFSLDARLHGHMPSTFAAFALLLAPYWFFGFGAAPALQRVLASRALRILVPGLLVAPYLLFAIPRGEVRSFYAAIYFALPVALAALFEFFPPGGTHPPAPGLHWQEAVALAAIGLPVEFSWLSGSFPHPGLSAMPKFLLVDAALYAFLIVRGLEGVGYDFRPCARDTLIGVRECAFFAVIAIPGGIALHFITPHGGWPTALSALSTLAIVLFFVAIPEELFFRGLLQNLLEPRMGRTGSLLLASAIFGLSHFNKPGPFNWRYVLLATIAGIFYGRAWRDRRRLLASAITHTLVDVIWTLWFR